MIDFKLGDVRMTVFDELRLESANAWKELIELEDEFGLLEPETLNARKAAVAYTDALVLVSGKGWVYSRTGHVMVEL